MQIAQGQQSNIKAPESLEIWSGHNKMRFCSSKIEPNALGEKQ